MREEREASDKMTFITSISLMTHEFKPLTIGTVDVGAGGIPIVRPGPDPGILDSGGSTHTHTHSHPFNYHPAMTDVMRFKHTCNQFYTKSLQESVRHIVFECMNVRDEPIGITSLNLCPRFSQ
jgi:hypothetical protein